MLCPRIFQAIKEAFGPLDVDLFASRLTYQIPCFFSWRPDPLAEAANAAGPLRGVANPPWCFNQQSTEPGTPPAGSVGANSASVEGSNLGPSAPRDVVGPSQADCPSPTPNPEAVKLPDGDGPSTRRVACLRERFSSSCLSEATKLLLKSWRAKSAHSYDSQFRKWAVRCVERGHNPVSGPASDVANFLAELPRQGCQSSSLNAFRSAISSAHDQVYGVKHPMIRMPGAQRSFQCQTTLATLYSHLECVDSLTLLGELGTLCISVTQAHHLQADNAIDVNQAILLCTFGLFADRPSTVKSRRCHVSPSSTGKAIKARKAA